MRLFYWIRAKFRIWNYKRKYGISIDEAMKHYGKYVTIHEKYKDTDREEFLND
jgi:hypothetical protein